MGRRRDNPPPFEVMRSDGRRIPPPVARESSGNGGGTGWAGSMHNALGTLKQPMMLRIPRGYAILFAAGFLGLIVLGYVVGYQRGEEAGARNKVMEYEQTLRVQPDFSSLQSLKPEQFRDSRPDEPLIRPPHRPSVSSKSTTDAKPPQSVPPARSPSAGSPKADPRESGLNYIRLGMFAEDEARRLIEFFAGHRVELYAKPYDNDRFIVYVTSEGFPRGTLGSNGPGGEFMRRMRELGRAWKRFNDNRGSDLNSMFFEKYQE